MNRDVTEAQVRAVLPLDGSFAVFLGNEEKTFVIYVDEAVGAAISMFMRGVSKERPLTHDLMLDVITALGAELTGITITALTDGVFYAELSFTSGPQVSARPSDAIALAIRAGVPIKAADEVLDAAGIELPDDEPSEVEVERFREFLDQVSPEDFQ